MPAGSWANRTLLLALIFLACVSYSTPTPTADNEAIQGRPGVKHASDADFIVAIGSTSSRLVLAQATRAWRSGIRTYIATNSSAEAKALSELYKDQLEIYDFFPDEAETNKGNWRANYAGDYRAGLAPWLAHRYLKGQYKWMLYGDDDTLFFMPGVRRLISQHDPSVPLALTDNLWYDYTHPRLEAPRCVPCGFGMGDLSPQQRAVYTPKQACPHCTRDKACTQELAIMTKSSKCGFTGAHGGAGVIISVALMEKLSYDAAVACMANITTCSGSDCLFSECMWAGGYGFTDPGYSLRANQPQSWILFDNAANRYALKAPIEEIVKGRCDTRCQHWLQHVVSFHLRGRSHSSFLRAAAVMYALTESHHAAMQYIDMAQGLEKDIAAGFRAEPDKDL